MIETLVALACVAGCVAVGASPLPSSDTVDPCGPRARATRRAELRFAATLLVVAIAGFGSLLALSYGRVGPFDPAGHRMHLRPGGAASMAGGRGLVVPLGMARTAAALTRLGGHPWTRYSEGGAVLAAVLAAARRRRIDDATRSDLAAAVRRGPLGGAGVVAAGLLAAADGDHELARHLLESVELLDPAACPPRARSIALDWLVADAARRGAWRELADRCETAASLSRTASRMHQLARHRLGERHAPSRGFPGSGRARARLNDDDPTATCRWLERGPVVAANDGGGLARAAVSLHIETLRHHPAGGLDALQRCAATWDATLWDFDFRRRLRKRVLGLDCTSTVERSSARLHRTICRISPTASIRPRSGICDTVGTLRRATELRRHLAVQAIETAGAELAAARERALPPPSVEVWATCMRVRTAFETVVALASADVARAVYAAVDVELGATAAWLWNSRREHGLATGLCTWLVLQAERVRDRAAAEHHRLQAARLA